MVRSRNSMLFLMGWYSNNRFAHSFTTRNVNVNVNVHGPQPTHTSALQSTQKSAAPDTNTNRVAEREPLATFGDATLSDETFAELFGDPNDDVTATTPPTNTDDSSRRIIKHLPLWLTDRLTQIGYTNPTLIQQRSLQAILHHPLDDPNSSSGGDVVIQAQTGSGKTLSYLLPLLSSIDPTRSTIQAIIIVPTRELGLQVARVTKRLCAGSHQHPHSTHSGNKLYVMNLLQGSQNKRQRAWAWADPPHVVIGTPAELEMMVGRGGMRYNGVRFVVVDEVDACLLSRGATSSKGSSGSRGAGSKGSGGGNSGSNLSNAGPLHNLLSRYLSPTFSDDTMTDSTSNSLLLSTQMTANELERLSRSPTSHQNDRQTIFASATIPQHNHFLRQCVQNQWTVREPVHVCLSPKERMPPGLSHEYVVVNEHKSKLSGLRRYLKQRANNLPDVNSSDVTMKRVLIFCDDKRPMEEMAQVIAKDLKGIVWKEGTKLEGGNDPETTTTVSVLRYEGSLSARASSMDMFQGSGMVVNGRVDAMPAPINQQTDGPITNEAQRQPLRILLSTDLAARGIDVVDVTHVIHFDLPPDSDAYIHRGGRAGRMGKTGTVVSLITSDQEFVLERLGNQLGLNRQGGRGGGSGGGGDSALVCVARQAKPKPKV